MKLRSDEERKIAYHEEQDVSKKPEKEDVREKMKTESIKTSMVEEVKEESEHKGKRDEPKTNEIPAGRRQSSASSNSSSSSSSSSSRSMVKDTEKIKKNLLLDHGQPREEPKGNLMMRDPMRPNEGRMISRRRSRSRGSC